MCCADRVRRARVALVVAGVFAGCHAPKPAPAAPAHPEVIANVAPQPPREAVAWGADDRAWMTTMLDELRRTGERTQQPQLVGFAGRTERLLGRAQRGELTKEQLLDELEQAVAAMTAPLSNADREKVDDLREVVRHCRRVPRD